MFDPVRFDTDFKLCFKYDGEDVFFLMSKRGEAIEIHLAATSREGVKALHDASKKTIPDIKIMFPWCKQLIAPVKTRSILKLCLKLGFTDCGIMDYKRDKSRIMVVNYG